MVDSYFEKVCDIRRCTLMIRDFTGDVPSFDNIENVCQLRQAGCDGASLKSVMSGWM